MFSELSSTVTEGIRVNVRAAYIKDESSPAHDHYVFAYQVQIVNESSYRVKLLSRKWFITDALGRKRIVSGDGVVGSQPVLGPGESHEYVSGCHFNTELGKMEGYYTMVREDDDTRIRVRIPAFFMSTPYLLN